VIFLHVSMPKSSHRRTITSYLICPFTDMHTFLCDNFKACLMHFLCNLFFYFSFLTGVTSLQMGPGFPITIPSLSVAADHYNKVQVS
jgi:hypothetical protein